MKYKKAISIPEIFALVIAAIALLVIFIPIGNYAKSLFIRMPNSEVTDSAKVFVSELNELHFDAQENPGIGAQINLALISQEEFHFRTYNPESKPPADCLSYSCFCVVDDNFNPKKCFPLHQNIKFGTTLQNIHGNNGIVSVTATAKQDPSDKHKTIITLQPIYT